MYVASYKFIMLNNLFMNHWGLQKRESRDLPSYMTLLIFFYYHYNINIIAA